MGGGKEVRLPQQPSHLAGDAFLGKLVRVLIERTKRFSKGRSCSQEPFSPISENPACMRQGKPFLPAFLNTDGSPKTHKERVT